MNRRVSKHVWRTGANQLSYAGFVWRSALFAVLAGLAGAAMGAPNVVATLIDDLSVGANKAFGGPIALLAEMVPLNGYSTGAFGKWHEMAACPSRKWSTARRRSRWSAPA